MSDTPPRNEAAMADTLASIRRIVAEEDKRAPSRIGPADTPRGEVFELTLEMRVDLADGAGENGLGVEAGSEMAAPSIDEAVVADIARSVIREELNGAMGVALTQNIKKMIREEVARSLAERG